MTADNDLSRNRFEQLFPACEILSDAIGSRRTASCRRVSVSIPNTSDAQRISVIREEEKICDRDSLMSWIFHCHKDLSECENFPVLQKANG